MKNMIVLLLFWSGIASAQESQTIYCNERQNVALIFENSIKQAVTGSENFVFGYNKALPDSLGLLQGTSGPESNLFVRTSDGELYSFILKHQDSLPRMTYFIRSKDQVLRPGDRLVEKEKTKIKENKVIPGRSKTLEALMDYYLKEDRGKLAVKRKNGLRLEIEAIDYFKDTTLVVFSFRNQSQITYEVSDLRVFRTQGKRSRKSSFQKTLLKPLFREHFPDRVLPAGNVRFLIAFPKFTLGDNESLTFELTEAKGNRYLQLKVKRLVR